MSIPVNRKELLNVLEQVKYGLSQKDTHQQGTCYVFQGGWVASFNDEVSCRMRTGLPADFTGAAPAEKLREVLTRIPDDDVSFVPAAAELVIKFGQRNKVGIRLEPEILLPLEAVESPGDWDDLPEEFEEAVKVTCAVAKPNADEFLCRCVRVHPRFFEATDRKQVVRYGIRTGIDDDFLVQQSSLKHLAALGMTRVSRTPEWLHFSNPGKLYFSCRRHRYDYPDLGSVLEFRGDPAVLPRGASDAAGIAEIFANDDKDGLLRVTLTPGEMTVRGEAADGWAELPLKTNYNGRPVKFRIAPDLLTRIVTKYNECEIGPGRAGLALRIDGPGWTWMTSLGDPAGGREPDRDERPDEQPELVGAADADGED